MSPLEDFAKRGRVFAPGDGDRLNLDFYSALGMSRRTSGCVGLALIVRISGLRAGLERWGLRWVER